MSTKAFLAMLVITALIWLVTVWTVIGWYTSDSVDLSPSEASSTLEQEAS